MLFCCLQTSRNTPFKCRNGSTKLTTAYTVFFPPLPLETVQGRYVACCTSNKNTSQEHLKILLGTSVDCARCCVYKPEDELSFSVSIHTVCSEHNFSLNSLLFLYLGCILTKGKAADEHNICYIILCGHVILWIFLSKCTPSIWSTNTIILRCF